MGPNRDLNPAQRIHSPICYQATLFGPCCGGGNESRNIYIFPLNESDSSQMNNSTIDSLWCIYKSRKVFIIDTYYKSIIKGGKYEPKNYKYLGRNAVHCHYSGNNGSNTQH